MLRDGPEGYHLEVTGAGMMIQAPAAAGLFYGCQTLRQLFPTELLSGSKTEGMAWIAPAVNIQDFPRFS